MNDWRDFVARRRLAGAPLHFLADSYGASASIAMRHPGQTEKRASEDHLQVLDQRHFCLKEGKEIVRSEVVTHVQNARDRVPQKLRPMRSCPRMAEDEIHAQGSRSTSAGQVLHEPTHPKPASFPERFPDGPAEDGSALCPAQAVPIERRFAAGGWRGPRKPHLGTSAKHLSNDQSIADIKARKRFASQRNGDQGDDSPPRWFQLSQASSAVLRAHW